ncbi:MAG: class II glutamine amidotransferase [Coxiellaceae bacterium]|nr:class II glutamine amidotransferase [Coxiellaceae bacterium]
MCRFVMYLGKVPTLLYDVIIRPDNSLVSQSLHAQKMEHDVNADGFGVGWYQHAIDNMPAKFKSTQPAWNDKNLHNMSSKILSKCFMGHVRRATSGDVFLSNCHPFSYQQYLFCHNGNIDDFISIQRHLRRLLKDEIYHNISGQTDSEHLFNLMMNHYATLKQDDFLEKAFATFQYATKEVLGLQRKYANCESSKLNTVLTDGERLMATRYAATEPEKELSLYYSEGKPITAQGSHPLLEFDDKDPQAIIVASEPLSEYADSWREVPPNHALLVDENLKIDLKQL